MEVDAKHPIIKQLREIRKNQSLSPEKYIEILETYIIANGELFGNLLHEHIAVKKAIDQIKSLSDESYLKSKELASVTLQTIRLHQDHLSKFSGKKVSPENREMYDEIKAVDKERMKMGQDSNFKQSTKVVAKRHHLSANEADRLYRNFIERKNNGIKKQSAKRKPS